MTIGFHEDTWDFPAALSLDPMPQPLKYRCYRVWQGGSTRSRFMTATQLRHYLGLSLDGPIADVRINPGEKDFNWERVIGGASQADMVDWNLRGSRY